MGKRILPNGYYFILMLTSLIGKCQSQVSTLTTKLRFDVEMLTANYSEAERKCELKSGHLLDMRSEYFFTLLFQLKPFYTQGTLVNTMVYYTGMKRSSPGAPTFTWYNHTVGELADFNTLRYYALSGDVTKDCFGIKWSSGSQIWVIKFKHCSKQNLWICQIYTEEPCSYCPHPGSHIRSSTMTESSERPISLPHCQDQCSKALYMPGTQQHCWFYSYKGATSECLVYRSGNLTDVDESRSWYQPDNTRDTYEKQCISVRILNNGVLLNRTDTCELPTVDIQTETSTTSAATTETSVSTKDTTSVTSFQSSPTTSSTEQDIRSTSPVISRASQSETESNVPSTEGTVSDVASSIITQDNLAQTTVTGDPTSMWISENTSQDGVILQTDVMQTTNISSSTATTTTLSTTDVASSIITEDNLAQTIVTDDPTSMRNSENTSQDGVILQTDVMQTTNTSSSTATTTTLSTTDVASSILTQNSLAQTIVTDDHSSVRNSENTSQDGVILQTDVMQTTNSSSSTATTTTLSTTEVASSIITQESLARTIVTDDPTSMRNSENTSQDGVILQTDVMQTTNTSSSTATTTTLSTIEVASSIITKKSLDRTTVTDDPTSMWSSENTSQAGVILQTDVMRTTYTASSTAILSTNKGASSTITQHSHDGRTVSDDTSSTLNSGITSHGNIIFRALVTENTDIFQRSSSTHHPPDETQSTQDSASQMSTGVSTTHYPAPTLSTLPNTDVTIGSLTTTTEVDPSAIVTPQLLPSTASNQLICNMKCPCRYRIETSFSIEKILKKLTIEKKAISSQRRKYVSAEDNRLLSRGMGYTGVALMVSVLLGILVLDSTALYADLTMLWRNIKSQVWEFD